MNACVEVCMYVCAMMCYLEAMGCERLHASAERTDHLRCVRENIDLGMKVVCYNKKWGPSHVGHAGQVTLKTGGEI
jgi:hypothetical protein